MNKMNKVLFVCLGNICRSPTAQGVFEQLIASKQLSHIFEVDSAGTSAWHIDEAPDRRTVSAAKKRGYELAHLRGRQASREDFSHFDFILAMDHDNLRELEKLKPEDFSGHLGLLLAFDKESPIEEVPDPYYGGQGGFDNVLDMVESACQGLLAHIQASR